MEKHTQGIDEQLRGKLPYLLDLLYGVTKYPWGPMRPDVIRGIFPNDENGRLQKILFEELLKIGFRKTIFQLILPRQTAGLVKKHSDTHELHVRMYNNGLVDCELEVGRFRGWHFVGQHEQRPDILEQIMQEITGISEEVRGKIYPLLDWSKSTEIYPKVCNRLSPETKKDVTLS